MSSIRFYKVRTKKEKVSFLQKCVASFFERKKALLIGCSDEEQALFIDDFLWKEPKESFIPHSILDSPQKELIAIAIRPKENLNSADALLNLTQEIPALLGVIPALIELLDLTDPKKEDRSLEKFRTYEKRSLKPKLLDF